MRSGSLGDRVVVSVSVSRVTEISSTRTLAARFARVPEDVISTLSDLFEELVSTERRQAVEAATYSQSHYLRQVESGAINEDHYSAQMREEIARVTTEVEADFLPVWEAVRADGDVVEAVGHALDVQPSLRIQGARSLIVTVGTFGGSSIRMRLDQSGARITIRSTPELLEAFAPRIAQVLTAIKPRWSRAVPALPMVPASAVILLLGGGALFAFGEYKWIIVAFAIALFGILYLMTTIPKLRIGPRIVPSWQKPAQWVASHLFAAGLGVAFAYWFGPR